MATTRKCRRCKRDKFEDEFRSPEHVTCLNCCANKAENIRKMKEIPPPDFWHYFMKNRARIPNKVVKKILTGPAVYGAFSCKEDEYTYVWPEARTRTERKIVMYGHPQISLHSVMSGKVCNGRPDWM